MRYPAPLNGHGAHMSQSSALPVRNSPLHACLWRGIVQPAHCRNMVADLLILLALAAAVTADNGSGVRVEARATATIERGVTLQNGRAVTRAAEVAPVRRRPRDCDPADKPSPTLTPDCRLIVYDLP